MRYPNWVRAVRSQNRYEENFDRSMEMADAAHNPRRRTKYLDEAYAWERKAKAEWSRLSEIAQDREGDYPGLEALAEDFEEYETIIQRIPESLWLMSTPENAPKVVIDLLAIPGSDRSRRPEAAEFRSAITEANDILQQLDARIAADKEAEARHKRRRSSAVRRQRVKGGAVEFTRQQLLAVWASAGISEDVCAYCGEHSAHLDHVMPLARGGTHEPANLLPACAECNLSKGAMTVSAWARLTNNYGLFDTLAAMREAWDVEHSA